jgi:hypothetical protein
MDAPVIYRGIKFPFQRGPTSFPREVTDDELIRDALQQLFRTLVGERIMRPDLGSNAMSYVFENNDAVLGGLLRADVQVVVAKYEPRVQVTDVQVEQVDSTITLTISYIVLATRQLGNVSISAR